jgi:hypothetical protein
MFFLKNLLKMSLSLINNKLSNINVTLLLPLISLLIIYQ